jgi:hypothetical protein
MRNLRVAILWTVVALQVALVPLGVLFEVLNRPPSSSELGFVVDAAAGAARS